VVLVAKSETTLTLSLKSLNAKCENDFATSTKSGHEPIYTALLA
jgi:hypothetical protein